MRENDTLPEGCVMSEWGLAIMELQINADERRFVVRGSRYLLIRILPRHETH